MKTHVPQFMKLRSPPCPAFRVVRTTIHNSFRSLCKSLPFVEIRAIRVSSFSVPFFYPRLSVFIRVHPWWNFLSFVCSCISSSSLLSLLSPVKMQFWLRLRCSCVFRGFINGLV
jgi:hypothetical protein